MSISGVTINSDVAQSGSQSKVQQAREDFEQLFQAMQAGNLASAQQAYTAVQQLQSGNTAGVGATTAISSAISATSSSSPIATDWSAFGQALQSGDLSSAQDAFAKVQQDVQAATQTQSHPHHHHGIHHAKAVYSAMQDDPLAAVTGATATPNADSSSLLGVATNDLAALSQALQSGNTSSSQDLLAKLEQDLKTLGSGATHQRHHQGGFSVQDPAAAYASATTPNIASVAVSTSNV